jgi:hypothetical protein
MRVMRQKSIDELEGASVPPPYPTDMVDRIARARRIAIARLPLGDVRLLVSQGHGVEYLLPVALEHLEHDPLLWAELYNGDLLLAALRAQAKYPEAAAFATRLRAVVSLALDRLADIRPTDWASDEPIDPRAADEISREHLEPELRAAAERLRTSRPTV